MQFSAISAQIYDSPAHQLTILLLTLAGVKPGSTENHENAILKIKESTGIKASFDSYALCQSGVTEPENRPNKNLQQISTISTRWMLGSPASGKICNLHLGSACLQTWPQRKCLRAVRSRVLALCPYGILMC